MHKLYMQAGSRGLFRPPVPLLELPTRSNASRAVRAGTHLFLSRDRSNRPRVTPDLTDGTDPVARSTSGACWTAMGSGDEVMPIVSRDGGSEPAAPCSQSNAEPGSDQD
jgi:hypothetical protein